jgi:hypothetical protein
MNICFEAANAVIEGTIIFIPQSLDFYTNQPIIGRNSQPMNTLFELSLIVVLVVVLIIKDLFVVRMATVRVK